MICTRELVVQPLFGLGLFAAWSLRPSTEMCGVVQCYQLHAFRE